MANQKSKVTTQPPLGTHASCVLWGGKGRRKPARRMRASPCQCAFHHALTQRKPARRMRAYLGLSSYNPKSQMENFCFRSPFSARLRFQATRCNCACSRLRLSTAPRICAPACDNFSRAKLMACPRMFSFCATKITPSVWPANRATSSA